MLYAIEIGAPSETPEIVVIPIRDPVPKPEPEPEPEPELPEPEPVEPEREPVLVPA